MTLVYSIVEHSSSDMASLGEVETVSAMVDAVLSSQADIGSLVPALKAVGDSIKTLQKLLVAFGAIECVTASLSKHSDIAAVQTSGLRALGFLMQMSPSNAVLPEKSPEVAVQPPSSDSCSPIIGILSNEICRLQSALKIQRCQLLSARNNGSVLAERVKVKMEHEEDNTRLECTICNDAETCMMFLPCRHACVCDGCDKRLKVMDYNCPQCRAPVHASVRFFLSGEARSA